MRKVYRALDHPSQDVPASPADEIQRETPRCSKSIQVKISPAEEVVRQAHLKRSSKSQEGPLLIMREYQDQPRTQLRK